MTTLTSMGGSSSTARPPTLRDLQREATRAKLLEIVIAMMEEGGEQAVRVRSVADQLGASVGAVYHHFESREDMIVAARIHQFQGALAEDLASIRAVVFEATTVEEFRTLVLAVFRVAHGSARARFRQQRAEVIGAARHNPQLGEALAETQHFRTRELADIIVQAQERGFIDPDVDPIALSTYMQGTALGLSVVDINTIAPLDFVAWAALVERVFDSVLVPRSAPPTDG